MQPLGACLGDQHRFGKDAAGLPAVKFRIEQIDIEREHHAGTEFVAELFEMLDFEVERVGGSGDQGADLRLRRRDGLVAVVQCKYHKQSLVGSPELQKFLGTIHHTRSQKGFFVTTSAFTLAAEKFAAENPIELLDGPRLVEVIHQALGPKPKRATEPLLF